MGPVSRLRGYSSLLVLLAKGMREYIVVSKLLAMGMLEYVPKILVVVNPQGSVSRIIQSSLKYW